MPSIPGQLRSVQPDVLELSFEEFGPLIVKLDEPLFGVDEIPVTLEFDNPDELHSGHPVHGKVEGAAMTLEVGNGVKIVGNLDNPEGDRPIKGFGDWMG